MKGNSNCDDSTGKQSISLLEDDSNYKLTNKETQLYSGGEMADSPEHSSIAEEINVQIASYAPHLDSMLGICLGKDLKSGPESLLDSMKNWHIFLAHVKSLIAYAQSCDKKAKSYLDSINLAKAELLSIEIELKSRQVQNTRLEKLIDKLSSTIGEDSVHRDSPDLRFRNEDIISKEEYFYSEESGFFSSLNNSKVSPDYKINLFGASDIQSIDAGEKNAESFQSLHSSYYLTAKHCHIEEERKRHSDSLNSKIFEVFTRNLKKGRAENKPLQVIKRRPVASCNNSFSSSRFNSLLRDNLNSSMVENLDSLTDIKDSFLELEGKLDHTHQRVFNLCKNLFNSYCSIRSRLDQNLELLNKVDRVKQRLRYVDYVTVMDELTVITDAFKDKQSKISDCSAKFTRDTVEELNEAIKKHDKRCFENSMKVKEKYKKSETNNCLDNAHTDNDQTDLLKRLDILNAKLDQCCHKMNRSTHGRDATKSFNDVGRIEKKKALISESR